ncbi:hypothetical protein ACJRO7_034497 [Eucalyptus globulus]|uniref:Cyclin-dependent kinase inhibitor domain-containing protein n=1 Tax=Eucalyptus globulus TaxID=34317 RepID=A0ABD3J703_EUCGL
MEVHRSKTEEEAGHGKPGAAVAPVLAAAEIEEFFAAVEGKLLRYYKDKYNYDFVKDEPVGGRYEWIRLKP